ncbi:hypothetical protein L3X38_003652 [Prunus dulcis]|uniref:Uncharacterized protein n=1 Tax=Prunus dulcis TaxID=3755 RepID=A0AAD5F289_PRUDU|nr:hypothetical protein L3X38_003652 [Prunus dulcis]
MDHVTSSECLKLDSQSEVLDKDGGRKDLFSPVMVPSNCNMPIIDSEVEEPKTTILDEDLEIYFSLHWGPPSPTRIGSKDEEPKIEELMDEELETEEPMSEIGIISQRMQPSAAVLRSFVRFADASLEAPVVPVVAEAKDKHFSRIVQFVESKVIIETLMAKVED